MYKNIVFLGIAGYAVLNDYNRFVFNNKLNDKGKNKCSSKTTK
mgnify:CR=1 FL=1